MTTRTLAVFSESGDGDLRGDRRARDRLSDQLGIAADWATVNQVHGGVVVDADGPGDQGDADGLFTTRIGVPLAVFTADCAGIVLTADGAIGVAHAGWRGVVAGVPATLRRRFEADGHRINRALIGPHIRSCCFEVGEEVAREFPRHVTATTWGTTSVDLAGAISEQLEGIDVVDFAACTHHETGWFSHRRDGDSRRLATVTVRRSEDVRLLGGGRG